ncbi:MAG: Xaa-Pro dipeptidase [Chlamydiota bacterium]|jgi:Xaa-Pro aminopeptidase
MDGWLVYDFQKINPLGRQVLKLSDDAHITRRIFYWMPNGQEPVKIVHAIEAHVLAHLPGRTQTYTSRHSLIECLKSTLHPAKKIAMEYSPYQEIPYLSKVDAGLVELIRSFGIEVVSSAPLLQRLTSTLTKEQLESHLRAAAFLNDLASNVWQKITLALKNQQVLTEYEVSQWMLTQMHAAGFITEAFPICAVNSNSANPHYAPKKEKSAAICKGDLILIDLWCKEKTRDAVYADISRVAVAASAPTLKQQQVFTVVRQAQKAATDLILTSHKEGRSVRGCDADRVCRDVIEKAGYGPCFLHRTGHNIHTELHGPGAHLDSVETMDTRELISRTCFSVEPGIYLEGAFGIRLEYDVYLGENGEGFVTGGVQESIQSLRNLE